ncbi:MAG: hypothetical protein QY306_05410 [Anaerolineales bacterium]|nr:MAG: hypothetical protein QY306_05410 [Anaerolineales bacterium]
MPQNTRGTRRARTPSGGGAGAAGPKGGADLSALFGVAAKALAANQQSLNQADTYNGNHGDNMVQMFNMLTQVMGEQKGASPSQQLNHASQYLQQHATSGSSQVYAQGLAQAAQQLQGQKSLNQNNAMTLVQSLLGGGQPAPQQSGGADLLGSLLGAVTQSQQPTQQQNDGIDMGDLLNAGMAFMNAKNQGQDNLQAGLSALMAAGPLGQSPHRQQSGQVIGNALLQAISMMGKK